MHAYRIKWFFNSSFATESDSVSVISLSINIIFIFSRITTVVHSISLICIIHRRPIIAVVQKTEYPYMEVFEKPRNKIIQFSTAETPSDLNRHIGLMIWKYLHDVYGFSNTKLFLRTNKYILCLLLVYNIVKVTTIEWLPFTSNETSDRYILIMGWN